MMFFAWSLVSSAVSYARRRRLVALLRAHLHSHHGHRTGLHCRCLRDRFRGRGKFKAGELRKAPSEPILNGAASNERVLFRAEELEVVVGAPTQLNIGEWTPSFLDDHHLVIPSDAHRVAFTIRVAPILNPDCPSTSQQSDLIRLTTTGLKATSRVDSYLIDHLANRVAKRKDAFEEMLYEAELNNFYLIVVYWSEGILSALDGEWKVVEICSVQLPDLRQVYNDPGTQSLVSSTNSLALYPSFRSLNVFKQGSEFIEPGSQRPFSLLEFLYQREHGIRMRGPGWRSLTRPTSNVYASDTALNVEEGRWPGRGLHSVPSPTGSAWESVRFRSLSPSLVAASSQDSARTLPIYLRHRRDQQSSQRSPTPANSSGPESSSPVTEICAQVSQARVEAVSFAEDVGQNNNNNTAKSTLPPLERRARPRVRDRQQHRPPTTNQTNNRHQELFIADAFGQLKERQSDYSKPEVQPSQERADSNRHHSTASTDLPQPEDGRSGRPKEDFATDDRLVRRAALDVRPSHPKPSERRLVHATVYESKSVGAADSNHRHDHSGKRPPRSDSRSGDWLQMLQARCDSALDQAARCRKRVNSLTPAFPEVNKELQAAADCRRRSLSPLSVSLLANFGALDGLRTGHASCDLLFRRRHSSITPKRLFHSMSRRCSAVGHSESNGTLAKDKLHAKPPPILIYTGDRVDLYTRIVDSLRQILPPDVYTLTHLSAKSLRRHPWVDENAACMLIADTKLLDEVGWSRLQAYFVHSGKILFICQNSLCASLSHCESVKKQTHMIKAAFGGRGPNSSLGKDFEQFMKKATKTLAKQKQVNEVFHAKDPVGGYKYSVALSKKPELPLLLYMENSEHQASALFSDATTEQLLSESGLRLIREAMARLGIELADENSNNQLAVQRASLICQDDKLVFDLSGLRFGEEMGMKPKFVFRPTIQLMENPLPEPSSDLLPVQVRRRKTGLETDDFDVELYFGKLETKSLGRVLLYVPVCESTISVTKSLGNALPEKDGILVVASCQTKGVGRTGNQWLSPKGCAMFTFDFNVPLDSDLGRHIVFVQHILAVSIVDAVRELVNAPDFPLRIKWPNDIYYSRSYKMGGVLVGASTFGNCMRCVIGAGLNVANSQPTVCINDMLPIDTDEVLTVEEVLAVTMNKFEHFTNMFVTKGKNEFLKVYHHYWLHSREEVTVLDEPTGQKDKVVIRGLDRNGYLEVRSKQTGHVFSVMDDGNTFDMMKGLIHPKGW